MSKYIDLINGLINDDEGLKRETELIALKYQLIRLLVDYRKNNNLSQSEFAEKIGIKQQMISRFEKGDVDPRLSFISKIIYGMNYTVDFAEKDYVMTTNVLKFNKKKKTSIASSYSVVTQYSIAN